MHNNIETIKVLKIAISYFDLLPKIIQHHILVYLLGVLKRTI